MAEGTFFHGRQRPGEKTGWRCWRWPWWSSEELVWSDINSAAKYVEGSDEFRLATPGSLGRKEPFGFRPGAKDRWHVVFPDVEGAYTPVWKGRTGIRGLKLNFKVLKIYLDVDVSKARCRCFTLSSPRTWEDAGGNPTGNYGSDRKQRRTPGNPKSSGIFGKGLRFSECPIIWWFGPVTFLVPLPPTLSNSPTPTPPPSFYCFFNHTLRKVGIFERYRLKNLAHFIIDNVSWSSHLISILISVRLVHLFWNFDYFGFE